MFEMTLKQNSTPLAFVDVPNTVTLARLTPITNEKKAILSNKNQLNAKTKMEKASTGEKRAGILNSYF
jgi:hypothetical protein